MVPELHAGAPALIREQNVVVSERQNSDPRATARVRAGELQKPGRGVPESERSPDREHGVRGVHWRPNRDTLSLLFSAAMSVSD